ncbi:MAG: DUF3800 domain-containing protein [Olegusella sp.]|nr:DUF3800 domain-containing protein [Olegusella sp.]
MRELSIFIDESGDFGPYEAHAPYYLITLVFHNQADPISGEIEYLERHVAECGFPRSHAVHAGPLIRREADYASLDLNARKKLFRAQFSFMRRAPIGFKTFLFHKKDFQGDHDALVSRMSRDISSFIKENLAFFQSFDHIIVYYDGGQKEITTIINTVLNALLEAEVRRVRPSDYRLFQAADMICTLGLLEEKSNEGELSKSERAFFGSPRDLRKNYLRPLAKMSSLPGAR